MQKHILQLFRHAAYHICATNLKNETKRIVLVYHENTFLFQMKENSI